MADKNLDTVSEESVVEEVVVEDTEVLETVDTEESSEEVTTDDTLEEAKSDETSDEIDEEDETYKLNASNSKEKKETWKKGKKMSKEDIDVQEHMKAMLDGQDLSEEFKTTATTIFEAAVLEKINEEVEKIDAKYEETLEENLVEIRTEISEKVDEYLTYVAKEWLDENKLAVENGLKLEIMENFISGLKSVFVENYVDIPEEKVDLYTDSLSSLEETQTKLDEEITKSVDLSKEIEDLQKELVLRDITEGLTLTQSEKLRSLSEGVEFVSTDDLSTKLGVIKENYFPTDTEVESDITDENEAETALEDSPVVIQEEASKQVSNPTVMDHYASVLTRFAKN
jgi:hypothetical protein